MKSMRSKSVFIFTLLFVFSLLFSLVLSQECVWPEQKCVGNDKYQCNDFGQWEYFSTCPLGTTCAMQFPTSDYAVCESNRYLINEGESMVFNEKTISLSGVSDYDTVVVDVDGTAKVIKKEETKTFNALSIKVVGVYYLPKEGEISSALLEISETSVNQTCEDSDGGKNYYVKGCITVCKFTDTSGGCGHACDLCSGNELTEVFCENNEGKSVKYTCPYGCEDGACIGQTETTTTTTTTVPITEVESTTTTPTILCNHCPPYPSCSIGCGETIKRSGVSTDQKEYFNFTLTSPAKITVNMQPDPFTDYDLIMTTDKETCPSETNYDCYPNSGTGSSEQCGPWDLPVGSYYITVKNDAGVGGYNLELVCSVQEICSGNIDLRLSPNTVEVSSNVHAEVRGTYYCGSLPKKDSCYGETACDSGAGCGQLPSGENICSCDFTSPSVPGSYIYYACVDKNDDTDYADPGETDSERLVVTEKTIECLADLNDDGKVDILDAIKFAKFFGSYPGHPRWNPIADINNDDIVDILDAIKLSGEFGREDC